MSKELDAFLEHHGVKGQRWGVINKDPLVGKTSTGQDASTKAYLAVLDKNKNKKISKKEQATNLTGLAQRKF